MFIFSSHRGQVKGSARRYGRRAWPIACAQRVFAGNFLGVPLLVYAGCAASDCLRTNAGGVGAVEPNEVFVGLGLVDEHASQELAGIGECGVGDVVSCFGLIEEQPRVRLS